MSSACILRPVSDSKMLHAIGVCKHFRGRRQSCVHPNSPRRQFRRVASIYDQAGPKQRGPAARGHACRNLQTNLRKESHVLKSQEQIMPACMQAGVLWSRGHQLGDITIYSWHCSCWRCPLAGTSSSKRLHANGSSFAMMAAGIVEHQCATE